MSLMRFLWTYLILAVVFAFGFVCASAFMVGMASSRRARRGAKTHVPNFYPE
jgi:hypothetical protein